MKDEVIENKQYWDSLIKAFLEKHPEIESAERIIMFDQPFLRTVSKGSKRVILHPIEP